MEQLLSQNPPISEPDWARRIWRRFGWRLCDIRTRGRLEDARQGFSFLPPWKCWTRHSLRCPLDSCFSYHIRPNYPDTRLKHEAPNPEPAEICVAGRTRGDGRTGDCGAPNGDEGSRYVAVGFARA